MKPLGSRGRCAGGHARHPNSDLKDLVKILHQGIEDHILWSVVVDCELLSVALGSLAYSIKGP